MRIDASREWARTGHAAGAAAAARATQAEIQNNPGDGDAVGHASVR
jgi:hypothetical protein